MRTFYIYLLAATVLCGIATPVQASLYLPNPTLVAPANGAIGLYGYAQLRWNYVPDYQETYGSPQQLLNFFNRYHVQVATDSSFNNIIYDAANLTDTTDYVFSLDFYTTYYWHVRVADFADTSGWSDTWNFRTIVGPPDLASPLDGALGVSVTPTLTWYQEPGATSYNLYIADDVETEGYIYTISNVVDTFTTVPPGFLDNSTYYYWWVEANEPGGTGYWSPGWEFLTIAAPPELVSPTDGATALSLTPELFWHTSSYALLYEVQVDDDPAFGSPEFQTSLTDTSVQIPSGVLNEYTVYYWRARLQETNGYSEWSDPWTFRTIVAPPLQLSPANSETGVPIDAYLEWYPSPGASAYEVIVFRDAAMTDTLTSGYIANNTLYSLAGYLVHFSNYYWKVRAVEQGGVSAWSPLWRFRVIVQPPVLVAPSNTETAVDPLAMFEWTASPNATGYRIQISEDQVFETVDVEDGPLAATQYNLSNPLDEYTVYYWHVAAIDPGGRESWSVVWWFRTIVPPPNPLEPPDNATAVLVPVQMRWTDVPDADAYRLQCSTRPDFSSILVDNSSVSSPDFLLYNIAGYQTIYWRLASVENGRFSRWSGVRNFRTLVGAPQPSLPVNNAKSVPTSPVMEWYELGGADSFQFQLARNETFETTDKDTSGVTGSSLMLQGLLLNTQYCWRLRAIDDGTPGPWSDIFTFKTRPPGPSLVSPDSGAMDLPVMQSFAWNAVNGAQAYRMQISTDSMFSSISFDKYQPGDTSVVVDPLGHSEAYYWRAQFINQDGESEWSAPWAFATIMAPPTAPTLILPKDGTSGEPVNTLLEWTSSGKFSYHVQLSLDAAFSKIVADDSGLSQTYYNVGPLDYGTDYFWRVAAKDAQDLFEWSSVSTFSTVVDAPDLLFPPNGDLLSPMPITMQWDAVSGADSYHIQIAGDTSFVNIAVNQSGIGPNEFIFTSPKPYTTYYWHVRATGKNSTGAWSQTWRFETSTPGPNLVSPANGASSVSIPTTFEWTETDGSLSYGIQIAKDNAFTDIVVQKDTITSTNYTDASLDYGTTYYWRVHAWNGQVFSGWSQTWRFTTANPPIAAPVLLSPPNGASGLDPAVSFRWEPSSGADTYRIQVATNESFSAMVLDEAGLSSPTYQAFGLSKGITYYWRVRGDASFGSSAWSDTWKFTTGGLVPLLVSPTNGAMFVQIPVKLEWRLLEGALGYRVQVSLTQGFAVTETDQQVSGSTTTLDVSGLENGKQYYWRVNATDAAGPTDWSEVWTFSTPPDGPALASPTNGAQQVQTDVTLQWLPMTSAQSYTVHVAEDPGFSTLVAQQSGIAGTSWQPAGLETDKTYYWRAKALFTSGESGWSDTWSFSTGKPPVVLVAPANTATDLPPAVDLGWQAYSGAASYRIQVAKDDSFTDILEDQNNISGVTYSLTALEGLTTYYWRALASTSTGDTPWSEIWKFSTATQIPALASPANNATNLSVPVTLTWGDVIGASGYELEVATDAALANVVVSAANESGPSYNADGLAPSQAHYWRVRAEFSFGTGPWSQAWMFTTEGALPVLISPENLATNIPLSPEFEWAPVTGAPSYDLQVATDAVFSVPVVNETGLTGTTYNNATLSEATTYFWRVRVSGGLWVQPWSFTTVSPLPGAPQLTSPVDGASGVTSPVVLRWQGVTNADDYMLEVSTSADMSSPVIVQNGVAATEYSAGGLTPGTTYFWHVAASNGSGTGPYSDTWSFTTQTTGALTVQYPGGTLGSGVTVTGTIPPGFAAGTATLFYKPIGAANFDSSAMAINGTQVEGTIPPSAVTIRGLAAWVRVVSSGGQSMLTDPETDPQNAPRYIRVSFANVTYPRPFTGQQYAMVSVPAVLDDPAAPAQFTDDYGVYDPLLWRVLRWNGTSYDEFPGIPGLANGGAWWMITQFGDGFDVEQGESVDPESEGSITLAPGWNQVGSPYAFNVDWAAIPGSAGLTGPFEFDGTEYIPDRNVLEAWKGYFVLNETSSPVVLDVLPVESTQAPGKNAVLPDGASFMLTLSIRDAAGSWRDTYNQVGLARDKAVALPEPPPVANRPGVSVRDEGGAYMRVLSPRGMQGNRWEMVYSGNTVQSQAVLDLRSAGTLPEGWSYLVIDTRTGKMFTPDSRQAMVDGGKAGTFIAAAGTPDYLARIGQDFEASIRVSGLGENYPNPFNPSTVIPFTLAEAAHVTIAVYDIHGRRIASLTDRAYEPGRYTVTWDAVSGSAAVPAGTYICRMTAGSRTWTTTLTFAK